MDVAGKLQEESASAQAATSDKVAKTGLLFCNGMSAVFGDRAQNVLGARAAAARGDAGADKALSAAEDQAEKVRPLTIDVCALAKKVAAILGAPMPVSSPGIPDTSRPVVAPPSLPAVSAPTGGAAGPAPAGPLPAVSSPVAPPVGVPSPSVPVVP